MSEDNAYKDGDIVWVKLGNSWWPGEVIGDEKRLPVDVHQFKKPPYCVVKFFQEDAYEYPKNAKQVYPFQCTKKDEFIKKGLALYNAKKAFMEKFPDDVKHAENLTKPAATTRIFNERPGGLVKEMWGHGLSRRSTDYENSNSNNAAGSHSQETTRRDSVTTILNITPNRASISATSPSKSATSARTLSTSSSASVTPNTAASSQYRCNMCDFTTMRQNVLIMHRKSHSSSGTATAKSLKSSMLMASTTSANSSLEGDLLNVGTKAVADNLSTSSSTPLSTKRNVKSPKADVVQEKDIELAVQELTSSARSRKKATASPSPKVSASKRTRARAQLAASPTLETDTTAVETENPLVAAVATSNIETVEDTDSKSQQTGTVSPTDSKNSEQIRQRLLADWSDEEKEENHEDVAATTSKKNKSSNTLQLPPSTNVSSSTLKRRSPTIVSMKTLEGAGQTLTVAASTQSLIVQEIITRTAQRIRNIPKKDRLRDFGNISTPDEQPKASDLVNANASKPTETTTDKTAPETEETNAQSATLSCFDFQEDEEEHENDVLKSIANYKKKYYSPDKDKLCQSTASSSNEHAQTKHICTTEQRDRELSAEIDSLLEQTTAVTQSLKEDASVKGLPIKERGKRIFKSRNRTRLDDEDGVTLELASKSTAEALDSNAAFVEREIKEEANDVPAAISTSPSERKTRGNTSKRTRVKADAKEHGKATSPVNGNKTPETAAAELPLATENVQAVGGMVYVSQSSKRKPYNHRIMRQLVEEDETSIPFIRHSPVEIYSCDSSLDNGTHVIRGGRRSKTTTPISLSAVNGEGSRDSSRNMITAPLTPTDETSSLGVSDAGAEFGSPESSLDDERLLTPVQDGDNQNPNEFEPIKESRRVTREGNDLVEEDEEIESPQHEALSGNELDEHVLEKGTKRLKSPKKKLNAKEQLQQETNDGNETSKPTIKRRSRAGTASPGGNDLPKRLTRGALQNQGKELTVETEEVNICEGTATIELKQKATERRSTPTRTSSRQAAAASKAADESSSLKTKPTEDESSFTLSSVNESISTDNIVPSSNCATVESPAEKSDASNVTTKRTTPQQKLKAHRSKTPATETKTENISKDVGVDMELNAEPQQKSLDSSNTERAVEVEKVVDDSTTVPEEQPDQPQPELSRNIDERAPNSSIATALELSSVASSIDGAKATVPDDIGSKQNTHLAKPMRKRRSASSDLTTASARTRSPHSPVKKSPRIDSPRLDSPHGLDKNSTPSSPSKKPSRAENSHGTDKRPPSRTGSPHSSNTKFDATDIAQQSPDKQLPDKTLSRTNSPPQSESKKPSVMETAHSSTKKHSRWDSPDKKSTQIDTQSTDKKFSRWDSPHSSSKKLSQPESAPGPIKKHTRWDSPSQAENNKNLEDTNSTIETRVDERHVASTAELSTQKEIVDRKSTPKKSTSSLKANEVSANVVTADLAASSIVENVSTTTTPAPTATINTSPTMEKVRINVDVANPLSTQIANILAASGNSSSIHSQQQLQLGKRTKSPKSNASCSPLKRKHSLEADSVVGSTAADGDAVVAHMQSLCPQVKITRKERIIAPTSELVNTSPKKSIGGQYDISQMPIVISNEQISAPKKSTRNSVSSTASALSVSNLWQTDLLQPPTTSTALLPAHDHQTMLLHESHSQQYAVLNTTTTTTTTSSPTSSTSNERGRLSLSSRSSQSPSPQKSPAGATGGRKQAGNTVTIPSSITVKQHQHKFAEALALADSVLATSTKPTKRRSSQTTPTSTASANPNRRLNSAPALDVRSTPPAKIPKITADAEQLKTSTVKTATDNSSTIGKTWSQSQRQVQKQKKLDSTKSDEVLVESVMEVTSPPSPSKLENAEENENVTDVEQQLNSTAKITAVPIQPIPGYAEPFLLCMLVDNMYKPINNIPHYLNTDLNQLVPVPPEAYKGMLPELAVDQPPASSSDGETNNTLSDGNQLNALNQQQHMQSPNDKSQPLLTTTELGESSIYGDGSTTEEAGFKLVLESSESALEDSAVAIEEDVADGAVEENATDNGIVLNLENQQIILDAATFEQLLANPDANTQLVTDDGTEFVLTREVLTALKAQHDGQNVELLAIPAEQQQQLQEQLLAGGLSEAGSSADLLSVALASSEFYGNDVLQIETTLGAVAGGAAGLQLLASDGSIVFQAPPLPQAHLTPPITAHTSETNAVLNQTPIMSTLEKPSTAVVGGRGRIETPIVSVVSAVECDVPGMRPNLDDSLAVIGVSTQSSTVPTSLELPITITNPAIAPKVTMAQSAHGADLVQFQPHRSVATVTAVTAAAVAANLAHIYDDPI